VIIHLHLIILTYSFRFCAQSFLIVYRQQAGVVCGGARSVTKQTVTVGGLGQVFIDIRPSQLRTCMNRCV